MKYNFDEAISRKNTDSIKYDCVGEACGNNEAIPLWVADMDFRTPPFIIRAIEKRLAQGILGYTRRDDGYYESICRWNREQYGMEVKPENICYVPGVVCGIYLVVQCLTKPGDKILIQEPVYHPFRIVPETCQREVVMSSLKRTEDSFDMDFDTLREDIKGCKLMILCNPHNPGGICWTREQLKEVAHICAENGVTLISDEIHCDMLLGGRRHIPLASVSDEAREISVTLQAPTKTYNMPGVVASQAIIYNNVTRERVFSYIEGCDMDLGNVFAGDCVKACYSDEALEWKTQMLDYVEGNVDYVCERLAKEAPAIRPIRPQASFLIFLDCRGLGFETQEQLNDFFAKEVGVGLNSGDMFGPSGKGYMRMNVGCPRATLKEAIDRIVKKC